MFSIPYLKVVWTPEISYILTGEEMQAAEVTSVDILLLG